MKIKKFKEIKDYFLDSEFVDGIKNDTLDEMNNEFKIDIQISTLSDGINPDILDFEDFLNKYTLSVMEKCMNFVESYLKEEKNEKM